MNFFNENLLGFLAFKLTGVYLRVVGLLDAEKILQPCLLIVVVFLVSFAVNNFFCFSSFSIFLHRYFHFIDHLLS